MEFRVKFLPGEYFWGGSTAFGADMPISAESEYNMDFIALPSNQMTPLFLSNKGRYIWSDNTFKVWVENGELCFDGLEDFELVEAGTCLRDAYLAAMKKHFPFSGKTMPHEFFTTAQYNTWMEFTYHPTQEGVLRYAHDIVDNGFEPGILIIDEGWHTRYGQWKFDFHKFPDPKAMIDELHELGFIVMLWVTPLVTVDGQDFIQTMRHDFNPETYDKLFMRNKAGQVAFVEWWNGFSAILDFRKECDFEFMDSKLQFLMKEYGVDGFKFDGGGYRMYNAIMNGEPRDDHDAKALNIAWNDFGARYKFHEYKDTFMGMGKPTIQRLRDKNHRWTNNGIDSIIPGSVLQGIMGYPFICPDMIGGGAWVDKHLRSHTFDEELFVRMAQVSALFPMMQYSWAPWDALSEENCKLVLEAGQLHKRMADEIIELVDEAAKTGEPVVRSLEYNDPGNGYETIKDQYMLGTDILVCPVVTKGTFEKDIVFPEGTWKDEDGNIFEGRSVVKMPSPLNKLLWFRRVK